MARSQVSCRPLLITLGLTLLTSALAQESNAPQAPPPTAGFRIAGTVVNSLGGSPLARARVTIEDARNPGNILTAISSEDGTFQIRHVPAGKYGLTGAKSGFIPASYEQHGQFSTAIVTGNGFDTEHLVLRLAPFAVVCGKVLDESGEPVRHARVVLYREDRRIGVEQVQRIRAEKTDDQGTYEFSGLPEGTYFLSASATPWYAFHRPLSLAQSEESSQDLDQSLDVAYPLTYYKDVTEADESLPIPLRGGDRLEADLHMSPVRALHLLFRVPGNGQNGFTVPMLQKPTLDGLEFVSNQAPQMISPGLYALTGIAPGAYSVRLPGVGEQAPVDIDIDISKDGQELDTSRGEPASVVKATVEAPGERTLPAGLSVALRNSKLRVVAWQQVTAKGEIEFGAVRPGNYEVIVLSPNRAYALTRISSQGSEIPGHTLNVTAGSALNISLSVVGSTMKVEGIVKRRNGKPVAGAMVVLIPQDPESNRSLFRRDQSDMDGSFSLPGVIPGTYTVVAIEDGWDLDWASPGVIASYSQRGNPIKVAGRDGLMQLPEAIEVQPRH
ncbi:MAG: carboxypeptidase regulatory-like domain-containing protein [Acidobacteria bacterium]|nr:carboxypeptidase regulatory-like domain-containing protein [Acidobacteriota bacterium]